MAARTRGDVCSDDVIPICAVNLTTSSPRSPGGTNRNDIKSMGMRIPFKPDRSGAAVRAFATRAGDNTQHRPQQPTRLHSARSAADHREPHSFFLLLAGLCNGLAFCREVPSVARASNAVLACPRLIDPTLRQYRGGSRSAWPWKACRLAHAASRGRWQRFARRSLRSPWAIQ